MIAHRLIEIHGIKDRCVEPREQLLCDDENFRVLADLGEALANLPLALVIEVPLLQKRPVGIAPGEDNFRIARRQNLSERFFIERAGFAIDAYEERLVPERLDVL